MASASGLCLGIRESISCTGMQTSEGKRKCCKASRKGYKTVLHPNGTCADVVSSGVCPPFVSPGVMIGNSWSSMGVPAGSWGDRMLLLIYTPVFAA